MEEQSIGDRIRELRQKLKYTQIDVARGTGIPQSNLSEFETGKLNPSMVTLKKLAHFFGVSLSNLFDDEIFTIESLKLSVRLTSQISQAGKQEILDFIDMVYKKEERFISKGLSD
ncbi:MAG: helix-turn-helix transcriptional regulator [Caldisericia bacterium]|nr:helix-turn-helix transcriptional regulator [Caldisericia bacterium]